MSFKDKHMKKTIKIDYELPETVDTKPNVQKSE
jgi:hypothetical protein